MQRNLGTATLVNTGPKRLEEVYRHASEQDTFSGSAHRLLRQYTNENAAYNIHTYFLPYEYISSTETIHFFFFPTRKKKREELQETTNKTAKNGCLAPFASLPFASLTCPWRRLPRALASAPAAWPSPAWRSACRRPCRAPCQAGRAPSTHAAGALPVSRAGRRGYTWCRRAETPRTRNKNKHKKRRAAATRSEL